MAAKKSLKTAVGSPLTPTLLKELGAFDEILPSSNDFAPDGNWVNTYRVWVCHGYRESGNDNVGFLRIKRVADKSEAMFTLKVDQQIIHVEGVLNTIRAEIACRNDPVGSPTQWYLSSRFIGPEEKLRPGLDTEEQARIEGETIEVTTSGRSFRRKGSSRLTADWCLFEAVQRLPFEKQSHLEFDLLEGLSLLRVGHRLSYRGVVTLTLENDMTLHGFHQLGHGGLPYEYWLDEQHRLVLVATLSRAYILDEQAEGRIVPKLGRERRFFQRKKRVYEGGKTQ